MRYYNDEEIKKIIETTPKDKLHKCRISCNMLRPRKACILLDKQIVKSKFAIFYIDNHDLHLRIKGINYLPPVYSESRRVLNDNSILIPNKFLSCATIYNARYEYIYLIEQANGDYRAIPVTENQHFMFFPEDNTGALNA